LFADTLLWWLSVEGLVTDSFGCTLWDVMVTSFPECVALDTLTRSTLEKRFPHLSFCAGSFGWQCGKQLRLSAFAIDRLSPHRIC